jgi:hypothetical protein
MKKKTVNVLRHKKTGKLHIEPSTGLLCGRGKWDGKLVVEETLTEEEFDAWVTDPEHAGNFSGGGVMPLRRGLCVGCRGQVLDFLLKIRKN